MNDKMLIWMQNWVFENYDDAHKLECMITLQTLGNPGWALSACLKNSIYQSKQLKIKTDRTEEDWCYCSIKDNKFEGRGGALNLNEMINYFRSFVEGKKERKNFNNIENEIINWMEKWYHQQCANEWEDSERFIIITNESGWFFSMFLEDTVCEDKFFDMIKIKKTEKDWYNCYKTENRFEAEGGIFNLVDILNVFINWVEE